MRSRLSAFFLRHGSAAVFAGYLGVVLFLHRSVVVNLGGVLLSGGSLGGGGEFFIWEFSWVKRALLAHDLSHLFYTTDLLFPAGTPVIFISPLLILASLVVGVFGDVYQTFNVLAMLSYAFTGFTMYLLARDITGDRAGAALAGFVFMFSHYNLTEHALGQLQEALLVFVPLVFLGLHRFTKDTGLRAWAGMTLCGVGVAMSSSYLCFEVFFIAVPLFALFSWGAVRDRAAFVKGLLAAGAAWFFAGLISYLPAVLYARQLQGGTEQYALSLLSFFDYPFWHASGWIQNLRHWTSGVADGGTARDPEFIGRTALAFRATPENLMGFFSLTLVAFIFLGARRSISRHKAWAALFVAGVVLSLGPWLQVAYAPIAVPLPYLLFKHLPLLGHFRAPSRMIVLSWLSLSVFAAVAFGNLTSRRGPVVRAVVFAAVVLGYGWEMGLADIGTLHMPLTFGPVYDALRASPDDGALLELPLGINRDKEISINAQKFMLYQPYHRKPLVVASPSRRLSSSLNFCESTEGVYELTHPLTLKLLYTRPDLAPRLEELKARTRAVLSKNGIRWVLFHAEDAFFSEEILSYYERFLADTLGPPDLSDEAGRRLYRV